MASSGKVTHEQLGVYNPARDTTDEVIQRVAAKDTKIAGIL
jgi:hypothetical protein